MLVLRLKVLLNVLELLLVAHKLILMPGLRKVAIYATIIETIAMLRWWYLHLSAVYLNWPAIYAVLTRIGGDHLLLHGS